jgi:hypothetical protein
MTECDTLQRRAAAAAAVTTAAAIPVTACGDDDAVSSILLASHAGSSSSSSSTTRMLNKVREARLRKLEAPLQVQALQVRQHATPLQQLGYARLQLLAP